jgi:hypothetical protein
MPDDVTLTTNNLYTTAAISGDLSGTVTTGLSYTYPYPYTYPWTYTYTSDPRVSELETKVELLEKMLMALLSGRPAPKSRRRKAA